MKQIKRQLANFSFFDQTAIEHKLEEMAARGWMLSKAGNLFWTYESVPPRKLRFAVTYFPGASQFDSGPSEKQLDKEDFCASDGWSLVLRWDAMQIFCTDREDAVPIETDPLPQVENIHQTMKKNLLSGQIANLVMIVWFLFLQYSQMRRDPAAYLSQSGCIFTILMFLLLFGAGVYQLLAYFRWHKKARKYAEDGLFYPLRSKKTASWALTAVSVLLLFLSFAGDKSKWVLMICLFALFAAAFSLGYRMLAWMKKKGCSRWLNLVATTLSVTLFTFVGVTFIVYGAINGVIPLNERESVGSYELGGREFPIYNDSLPLEVEDLVPIEQRSSKEADFHESVILAYGKYRQDSLPSEASAHYDLRYEITDIKLPVIYQYVRNSLLNARQDEVHGDTIFTDHFEPIDPTPWKAREAYQLHWSGSILDTYLVCWEDRIVEITFYWEPTAAHIALAADKLMH